MGRLGLAEGRARLLIKKGRGKTLSAWKSLGACLSGSSGELQGVKQK